MKQLYIGIFSMMPTEIVQRLKDDNVFVKKAYLGLKEWTVSSGHNPPASFSFFNDAGAATFETEDGKLVPYNYHQSIAVFEETS